MCDKAQIRACHRRTINDYVAYRGGRQGRYDLVVAANSTNDRLVDEIGAGDPVGQRVRCVVEDRLFPACTTSARTVGAMLTRPCPLCKRLLSSAAPLRPAGAAA